MGISADTPETLKAWKEKQDLPYDLLSDPELEVLKSWGAEQKIPLINISTGLATRSHWIIDENRTLLDQQIGISPKDSIRLALASVKS